MNHPSTPFDYPGDTDAVADEGSSSLHDSYQLLRSLLEFACIPQDRFGTKYFHPEKIGIKVLTILYAIDPTLLAVHDKEDLLKRMSPGITRRAAELIFVQFKAHIRANRALFSLGDAKAVKPVKNLTMINPGKESKKSSFNPTPRKESPTPPRIPVVPQVVRRSRAAGTPGRVTRDRDDRDGGRTITFLVVLGVAA